MHLFSFASPRKVLLAAAAAAFLILAPILISAQDDPPAQAGRLSYISGNVSIQQVGSDDWGQALPNLPFGPGDRVVTEGDGRAEIQVGQTYFRIGPNSDVSFVDDTAYRISVGLAQGSIHIHCFGLWPGQRIGVNTPSGGGGVDTAGEELRVDVLPSEGAAIFTNLGAQAFAGGPGIGGITISTGQALELIGSNPVVAQWLQPASPDSLDLWSQSRDQQIRSTASYRYVSPEIAGAYELDAAGDWQPDTPYGPVWFPRNVPNGWAPYHYGHWINHVPWGWVWVEDESWGYAPFHYGRWVSYDGRWGWVPGPPAAHPVWSPALVVFAGGIHVGGAGVSAWFPLGPGEPYHPWYHASPHYIDEVNISNIRESPRIHVQNTYVNINVVNITYVNRTTGVSAMRQEDFAAGRSAHQAPVIVDVHAFDHVQVVDHIDVPPPAHPFAGHPPARPVHVSAERPALINASGKLVSAKPGAPPIDPPVRPVPPVRPLPGRTVIASPPVAPPPAKTVAPVKPDTQLTPTAHPATSPASKPADKPQDKVVKPPVAPAPTPPSKPADRPESKPVKAPPAKPAVQPPAKPVAPTAGKPQDKVKDKDKKDEKKKEN
ncbi:MAG: DUF6600 domain-containing protein [Terracidiphilus sp.]